MIEVLTVCFLPFFFLIQKNNIRDNNQKTIENNPMTLIANVCLNDFQHVQKKIVFLFIVVLCSICYHNFIIQIIIIHHRLRIDASLPVVYTVQLLLTFSVCPKCNHWKSFTQSLRWNKKRGKKRTYTNSVYKRVQAYVCVWMSFCSQNKK